MDDLHFDIVIIGTGLGAAAIAQNLRPTEARIVMVPGVGCARFKHLDGGLIAAGKLESVFGSSTHAPLDAVGDSLSFRRDLLEAWAIHQLRDHVTVIDDFADLRVVPHASGNLTLHEESGRRAITASLIVLTEGASPKIGIAAKIRPDFEPEDLLHFGRTILSEVKIAKPVIGTWRTSWSMPAWYSVLPHPNGAFVSASARIENLMRAGRDGREVLQDFLRSPIAAALRLPESAETLGMELVPLTPVPGRMKVGTHRMVISPDANGTIDPRSLTRFADVMDAGAQLGSYISRHWPQTADWDDAGRDLAGMFTVQRTPYHDASDTGFIEEGASRSRGLLRQLLRRELTR